MLMEYKDTTITLSEKLKKIKNEFPDKKPQYILKIRGEKIIYCKTDYQPLIDLCNNQD
jgi:hypothetical protein